MKNNTVCCNLLKFNLPFYTICIFHLTFIDVNISIIIGVIAVGSLIFLLRTSLLSTKTFVRIVNLEYIVFWELFFLFLGIKYLTAEAHQGEPVFGKSKKQSSKKPAVLKFIWICINFKSNAYEHFCLSYLFVTF